MAWSHGTNSGYSAHNCRCGPCTVAHRVYIREWMRKKRDQEYGFAPVVNPYLDNTEAAEHLAWLSSQGVGRRTISQHTGLAVTTLWKIQSRQAKRSQQVTINKILAVHKGIVRPGARIDAGPTWALVDELRAHGWSKARISAAIGRNGRALQIGKTTVRRSTAQEIADLHARTMAPVLEERRMNKERAQDYRRRLAAGEVIRRERKAAA